MKPRTRMRVALVPVQLDAATRCIGCGSLMPRDAGGFRYYRFNGTRARKLSPVVCSTTCATSLHIHRAVAAARGTGPRPLTGPQLDTVTT